jgi:hypothetical protein
LHIHIIHPYQSHFYHHLNYPEQAEQKRIIEDLTLNLSKARDEAAQWIKLMSNKDAELLTLREKTTQLTDDNKGLRANLDIEHVNQRLSDMTVESAAKNADAVSFVIVFVAIVLLL